MVIRFLVRASPKSRGGWAGGFSHYVIIPLCEHDHKNSCCRTVIYTFSNKGIKYCVRLALRPGFNINKITKESKLTVLTHEVALSAKGAGQLFAHAQ